MRDESCGINDPNFPFFDPVHKLYHHFYQDHLCEDQGGKGAGPVIGHVVSSDMVDWARLPVALWNDHPYDSVAIYSGSATFVNGVPMLVYPGLCEPRAWPQCQTGTVLATAVPADLNDALYTNWTKSDTNPIVENAQRDPTTAWFTAAGEWRFTTYTGTVYGSTDFVKWYPSSNGAALFAPGSECPDFFPVPAPCVGPGCDASGPSVTHVYKQSSSGQDWCVC